MIEPNDGLTPEQVFTEGEMKLINDFLRVVDNSPILDPRQDGHNEDFFAVASGIEVSREGMLKIRKLANYNSEIKNVIVTEVKDDIHVTVVKRVWDSMGTIETVGGASWSEVAPRKARYKSGPDAGKLADTRIFNDVVTRADTRADKRGVEMKVGIPFVNMVIKMLFGGYTVGREERKELPKHPQRALPAQVGGGELITSLNEILLMLRKARDEKVLTAGEMGVRWNSVQKFASDPKGLREKAQELKAEIEGRKAGG